MGQNRLNTIKSRFTQYDFLTCDKVTPCTRARVLTHPLLVYLIFPKYSPVRNKNVITGNLPTGLDLTRVLFRDTEQTNPKRTDNKSFIVLKNPNHNNRQSLIRHIFVLVLNFRVRTGPGKLRKSWNFIMAFSRTGKSCEKATSPGTFWKSVQLN